MKEPKPRRRKTESYAPLCEIFYRNLNDTLDKMPKKDRPSNKGIAAMTCASETTVGHWLNGRALPTVDQLYRLASYIHVSIDYLLSKKQDPGLYDYKNLTYYNSFLFLYNMIKKGTGNESGIEDYFLDFLVSEALKIDENENLSDKKKNNWFNKIEKDFSVPLFEKNFLDMYLNPAKEVFAEVGEYDAVVGCLKGLQAWERVINKPVKSKRFDNFGRLPFAADTGKLPDINLDDADEDLFDSFYPPEDKEFSLQSFYEWANNYIKDK